MAEYFPYSPRDSDTVTGCVRTVQTLNINCKEKNTDVGFVWCSAGMGKNVMCFIIARGGGWVLRRRLICLASFVKSE